MKKICLIILCLFVSNTFANAIDTSLCAQPPYDVSTKFSQVMSQISGSNFMATKMAEMAIQSQIKKQFGSKGANVEIIPYSFGDFTKGKFKTITISIPQASSEDLAFSNFKAKSLCEFNHVIVEKKQVKFAENFLMEFSSDFTNDDLNKIKVEVYKQKMFSSNEEFSEVPTENIKFFLIAFYQSEMIQKFQDRRKNLLEFGLKFYKEF